MYSSIFFILLLFFTGCANKIYVDTNATIAAPNKKLFAEEDSLIMFALRAEQIGDFKSAAILFEQLYTGSKRKEYIYRSLQNRLYLKENELVITHIDKISTNTLKDFVLIRLKVVALMQEKRFTEAENLAINLVQETKSENDYILLSDIYSSQKKFNEAIEYLESGYSQEYSEKILDKLALLLYVKLERKKEAIAYLETHTMVHGCSVNICKRLISLYGTEKNIDGLLSTYLKYYEINSNQEVSEQIVQLYGYKQQYAQLILFLEESGSNNKVLLDLYVNAKNYKKAFPLAKAIYDDTGETHYLGNSVIYEYESQENKNDKAFLSKISKKFEIVLQQDNASLYLNYFGYILIDHNVDIDKGMGYVKKALEQDPESSYYLDSLAWGHYKRNECVEALKIIEKARKLEGGDDLEVLHHYKLIKKCKGKK